MTKKLKKNNTPKERVEEFLQECELYEEETNGLAEELPCYKRLVRDLEVLELLKKRLEIIGENILAIKWSNLTKEETKKIKEWLDENKTN